MTTQTSLPRANLRVAFTSVEPNWIDGHFGNCQQFSVYDVNASGYQLVDTRPTGTVKGEARTLNSLAILQDCQLVFTLSIGGPPAARLINAGIMPVKWKQKDSVQNALQQLVQRLASNPAPWLRKWLEPKETPLCQA